IVEMKYRREPPALLRRAIETFKLTPVAISKYRLGSDALGQVTQQQNAMEPGRKAEARDLAGTFLAGLGDTTAAVLIRVNAAGSEWIDDDCDWVRGFHIDGVVVPKAENPESIEAVANVVHNHTVLPLQSI